MAKNKKISDDFEVVLKIGNDVYTSSGETILHALKEMDPRFSKGIGSMEITYKGTMTRIPIKLTPTKLERIFGRPVDLEIFAKRLNTLR